MGVVGPLFGGSINPSDADKVHAIEVTVLSGNTSYLSVARLPAGAVVHQVQLYFSAAYSNGATLAVTSEATTIVPSGAVDPSLAAPRTAVWAGRVLVPASGQVAVTIGANGGVGAAVVTVFYAIPLK